MATDVYDIMIQIKEEGGFFRVFSKEELDLTSTYFKLLEYPAGSVPAKSGEPLNLMGIVVSGEAIYEEETEFGKWIVQARMTRGSILAHPSMFGVKPPPVRVFLPKDSAFLAIDGPSYDSFLMKYPEIGVKFQQELIRVLFIRLRNYASRFTGAP
ncbi:MAG: Crp/Fnr family transcriptional regulator [Nitrospira sp.]|nr:Crp/Fnr family transcriptional regulator [Nitrospira sp.]